MTEVGSVLGTAQYLAPEQAQGQQVDERSDLYSVGIVLYEMLTGTVPFKGDTAVTVALKHVNEAPAEPSQIVPGMPYALNQIVLKAIAKDRNARYQTAEEFARDLRSAQAGGPLIAAAYDPSTEQTRVMSAPSGAPTVMAAAPLEERVSERGRKRRAWPVVLLVAVLLLAIGGAAYGLVRAMGGGGVAVPSVVGQSTAAAIATLKDAGFAASVAGEEFSDEYAEGDVVRQEPKAGTELAQGRDRRSLCEQGRRDAEPGGFQGLVGGGGPRLAEGEWAEWGREDREIGRRRDRTGVQAGSRGRGRREARRLDHLLGEQRRPGGDRAEPRQYDASAS